MSEPLIIENTGRTVYSVSELNQAVRELLEHSFPLLWIEGEISNLAQPRSGHWYFSLKDDQAQVRCAMFRNKNQLLRFTPEHGMQVMVRAKISLYPARGDYQIIVEHMEQAGAGALQRAFEQLQAKLSAEGLFDEAHKRPLPAVPQRIGVITSATGAALRDVLSVLRRRFPMGRVLLHPVPVQGDAAAPAICQALDSVGRRGECDVVLLVRGGGSLEDLWAFNEESVARAVRACAVPVVAGVGHEIDVTITDYAADVRAPTPSAAAELVCPDQQVWLDRLQQLKRRVEAELDQQLAQTGSKLDHLQQRLHRLQPQRQLQEQMQRLDELEQRMRRSMLWGGQRLQAQRQQLQARLWAAGPHLRLTNNRNNINYLQSRMSGAVRRRVQQAMTRWQVAGRGLQAVSPLNTLERGYAIATDAQGRVITAAAGVAPGEPLKITLRRGWLDCAVITAHPQSDAAADETQN